MKSWRDGKRNTEKVVSVCFALWFMTAVVMLLVSLLGGCAAYPRTLAPIPLDVAIEPLMVVYGVQPGPGDEKKVSIEIGEMRAALATAERYEAAVASQNLAVEQVDVLLLERREANARIERAVEVGRLNSMQGFLVGFTGGVAAVTIISLAVR